MQIADRLQITILKSKCYLERNIATIISMVLQKFNTLFMFSHPGDKQQQRSIRLQVQPSGCSDRPTPRRPTPTEIEPAVDSCGCKHLWATAPAVAALCDYRRALAAGGSCRRGLCAACGCHGIVQDGNLYKPTGFRRRELVGQHGRPA